MKSTNESDRVTSSDTEQKQDTEQAIAKEAPRWAALIGLLWQNQVEIAKLVPEVALT